MVRNLFQWALRISAAVALAGFCLSGCGNPQSPAAAIPSGWVRDCPGNAFCFQRPSSLVLKPAQVIDSLAAEYSSDELVLRYDYGRYPTSLAHLINPREEKITVDGRPAKAIYSESEVVLVVPKVHEAGAFSPQLTMTLVFKVKASADVASKVFKSVVFMPPR